jgi:branched-chain amino acid transport system ATP-binding protein
MPALLEVDRISKSFSGLRAVQDVSFQVPEGEIVAMIGPNGAGKTTCFNVIAGVYRADAGEVRLGGTPISGWRSDQICRAGVARTFQLVKPLPGSPSWRASSPALAPASVAEAGRKPAGHDAAADGAINGGLLRRRAQVWRWRALATRPRILLLDEVMGGLRPTEMDHMVAFFRELNASLGLTILLVEHVMRAVMALSKRIIVLHHGQVIAAGSPDEVTRDPAVLECYLGEEAV